MLGFLLAHVLEGARAGREILAQPLGEFAVNAPVLLLQAHGQREDFPLTQFFESDGHGPA